MSNLFASSSTTNITSGNPLNSSGYLTFEKHYRWDAKTIIIIQIIIILNLSLKYGEWS